MKFMMLMIPAVYQGGKKRGPDFVPDPEKIKQMTQFNEKMIGVFGGISTTTRITNGTRRRRKVRRRFAESSGAAWLSRGVICLKWTNICSILY
jgi:hypothetical protein